MKKLVTMMMMMMMMVMTRHAETVRCFGKKVISEWISIQVIFARALEINLDPIQ